MATIIRTRLIKIGNSQGIRIPKTVLEQLQISDMIELEMQDDQLIVRPSKSPRANWATAFQEMAPQGEDQLLDGESGLTEWEEAEWEW